jgi:lipopolysaccharide/colanic/teichoic acid biosynthesis glycosyltransferase
MDSDSMFLTARDNHALDTQVGLPPRKPAPPATARAPIGAERAWELAQRLIGLALLIFVLPLMLVTAVAILMQDGGPVVFKHRRIGHGGRAFYCFKFRSMAVDSEARLKDLLAHDPAAREEWTRDQKLRRDPRITRLGAFLRKTSLDELPQLVNVVRGEMNLVGPRPIVEAEAARYGRRIRSYQAVRPGITGLWQVSGRNDVAYSTRVALDTLYARRRSVGLDLWILVRTVPAVLLRQGSC